MQVDTFWGLERVSKSAAIVERYVEGSRMRIIPLSRPGTFSGDFVGLVIEIAGECARIPSHKQARDPKRGFVNPEYMARLKALDKLYAARGMCQYQFADRLQLLLICSSRDRDFDPDNALSTVKDWLEPASKLVGPKKHPRGWGVGLIANDKQIRGQSAYHAEDIGFPTGQTVIVVRKFSEMRTGGIMDFVMAHFEVRAQ